MLQHHKKITLVGAGPVGALLSIYLARRGYSVDIFESRPDIRKHQISAGRSINLALSTRGIHALEEVGLKHKVMNQAIPMLGRMMHGRDGALSFQRYGRDDSEFINSVSRGELNKILMTHAEETGKVKIHFESRVTAVDLERKMLTVKMHQTNSNREVPYETLIGTDGSASAVRSSLHHKQSQTLTEDELDYGYKEFHIPAGKNNSFLMEKNALHIWPRGTFMLIALPNSDGSFTATLFLPHRESKSVSSFASIKTPTEVKMFFERDFHDVLKIMPELVENFFDHPTGHMVTVKCAPWRFKNDVLLVGDAAHAIVPFFGQGMNCGFEDCSKLAELYDQGIENIFETFEKSRKENCDAIADMAVENFTEMRDRVGDKKFLLQKEIEQVLQKKFPEKYISRYRMVTFSRIPYTKALKVGVVQNEILEKLSQNIDRAENVNFEIAEKLIHEKLEALMKDLGPGVRPRA